MDYLDTKKEFRHHVLLTIGYFLVAIAITIATLILLQQAYGFGLDKNGQVVQNGLTFFSSHPSPANIYVNGQLKDVKTNTRLYLPAGVYDIKLGRDGYHDWHRHIEIMGGDVQHFDYPFLIPHELSVKKIQSYTTAPAVSTQSPDRRWLIVSAPDSINQFHLYDLKNPDKVVQTTLALPADLLTKPTATETWQPVEWAADNQRVLLQHIYDGRSEFVIIDRSDPARSINLNTALSINPTKLTLIDKKYDKYYIYDQTGASLDSVSLNAPVKKPLLQHVLAYKTYGEDTILYATDDGAPHGKVLVKLTRGGKTWTLRSFTAGSNYVLDLTKYSGAMYVAIGAAMDNRVYIYKDPEGQLSRGAQALAVPLQVLHIGQVNYLSFSASAQFIAAENGQRFSVYDIENENTYNYTSAAPLDAPQLHASWMDGNRLTYVSGGQIQVFDYDNLNAHRLGSAAGAYLPAFAPDFKHLYTLAPAVSGQADLNQTTLVTKPDL